MFHEIFNEFFRKKVKSGMLYDIIIHIKIFNTTKYVMNKHVICNWDAKTGWINDTIKY
jgi:hypothetical protein